MPDIDLFMQSIRRSISRTLLEHNNKQPEELTEEIMEEIRKSVKKLMSKATPIITLSNAKIYVENGMLHVEAWDTNFSVHVKHTELDTGHAHLVVQLAREDMDKLLEILTIRTSREL